MSNIMSMASVKNKPSRNGFDLSCKNAFTAKAGELLPVMCKEVLPGDKFKIRADWFTRTKDLNTAAFTRMREYYDFFFVPSRLLWRYWDSFIEQMEIDNSSTSDSFEGNVANAKLLPSFTATSLASYYQYLYDNNLRENDLGFDRITATAKLLSYLDYGDNIVVDSDGNPVINSVDTDGYTANDYLRFHYNVFPLAAYQKIYADYYRFDQWESTNPSYWNFDYLSYDDSNMAISMSSYCSQAENGSTLFDLRYANWNKDLFHGVLPNSQYGDVASVSTADSLSGLSVDRVLGLDTNGKIRTVSGGTLTAPTYNTQLLNDSFKFNILALRQAEFLQRWKEVTNFGKKNYKDQIEQHWNVKVPNVRASRCEFLGGLQSNLNINEVVNSNLTDANPIIKGKSVGVGNGYIDFDSNEHGNEYGYIMCIYHCVPILDYNSSGTAPINFKTEPTDFAIPELDRTGMQLVPPEWLNNDQTTYEDGHGSQLFQGDAYLGYAPRYIDYKTDVDKIHGDFNYSLKHWVAPLTNDILHEQFEHQQVIWEYSAMKVNPRVLDSIFAVNADDSINTDQLLCNVSFDCKAVRNLDVNGLPY